MCDVSPGNGRHAQPIDSSSEAGEDSVADEESRWAYGLSGPAKEALQWV